jgi:large subunit ribosomal protein L1
MRKLAKRYRAEQEKTPGKEAVSLEEAVQTVKQFTNTKFDQTVELSLLLGIDPKQADQMVRGSLSLPKGIGKTKRVVAFCDEGMVEECKAAGAMEAGGEELVKKIQDGWMDFDVAVAHPKMMGQVGRLGRVLGPQGKMPSPKSGTVAPDVVQAVRDYAAGKLEYRNDDGGNIHAMVGKVSFSAEDLVENIQAFLDHMKRIKPSAAKGAFIRKAHLSATMSPSVRIAVG